MIVLGLNSGFGGGYQDSTACLMLDGNIIAAVEEERLIKVKFATGIFPLLSIKEVLSIAKISIKEVDVIAFHGKSWNNIIDKDIHSFFLHHFNYCPKIQRFYHHDAHAASTFYCSSFNKALVVTADNSGDGVATQLMIGNNGKLKMLKQWYKPNSFGTFYSCITQLIGLNRDADEYKMMGLAPYGNPTKFDFSFLLNTNKGNYNLNSKYLYPISQNQSFPNKQIPLYNHHLLKQLKLSIQDIHNNIEIQQDLAASAQSHLENTFINWLQFWLNDTSMNQLCFAGGVAMNCALNKKISEINMLQNLYIPPFAGDQGISIGNSMLATHKISKQTSYNLSTPFLGKSYTDKEVIKKLDKYNIKYELIKNKFEIATSFLIKGKVIGWFQGKSEIGARALGNRSILANPSVKGIKQKINLSVKFREIYRPFCPSVLLEDASLYFKLQQSNYPFMNINVEAKSNTKKQFPDIVHIDNTARIQTVSAKLNPIFYQLLLNFKKKSGYGMLLNTSLNTRNQPMCYDIEDVLQTFFSSGLDALFIEDILIQK